MRTLVLDRLPPDVSASKDTRRDRPIIGEAVHDGSFVAALEQYGTYDDYFYLLNNPFAPVRSPSRIRPLAVDGLDELRRREEVVLFTSNLHISKYAPVRTVLGRPGWPLCGLTHSLADSFQFITYLSLGTQCSLHEHDAIVCSTVGARRTILRIFEAVGRSSSIRPGTLRSPSVQLPIIPLGVEIGASARRSKAESRRSLGLDETTPVFLSIGRLSPVNKADLLPLLYEFLRNDELPAATTLILAGDDTAFSLADSIRAAAASIESDKTVRVMPNITSSEKNELFSAADVFLGISDTFEETFGIAIVEAMLHELPVIAADWEGFRHLITHDREGLLIPTVMPIRGTDELSALIHIFPFLKYVLGQRVALNRDALRRSLTVMARNPELRARLGSAARERAESTYAWRTVIGQFEQLWSELLDRGRRFSAQNTATGMRAAFLDYGEAFSHYATQILTDDRELELTALGATLVVTPSGLAAQWMQAPCFFSRDLDQQILTTVALAGRITMGEICDRLVGTGQTDYVVASHIGRLVKYGIASPVVAATNHSPVRESAASDPPLVSPAS